MSAAMSRRMLLRSTAAGAAVIISGRYASTIRAESPAEIRQITNDSFPKSNIYCEIPYCSRSSRYLVYVRQDPKLPINDSELMVVALGTWKQDRLDACTGIDGIAMSPQGVLFYLKRNEKRELDLMRVDLEKGTSRKVYSRKDGPMLSMGSITSDEKYYTVGVPAAKDWTDFGIVVADLEKGTESIIDRDPFILNPHPQFDPGNSRRLLIQHNRGGKYRPDGTLVNLVGQEGATLYVLSLDGKRTELKVGKPYTAPCTGHETWIGSTGEILLSVEALGENVPAKGNLLAIRPGEDARVIGKGYRTNHLGVSRCGRFYSCDDWQPPYKIIIGSIRTGRSTVICESQNKIVDSHNSHPHPYITPDLKYVIFNSNRTGSPQIYAAAIPESLIAELDKA